MKQKQSTEQRYNVTLTQTSIISNYSLFLYLFPLPNILQTCYPRFLDLAIFLNNNPE